MTIVQKEEGPPEALLGTKWKVFGFTVHGPGSIEKFRIDGRLVFPRVTWFFSCICKPGVGLICDGVCLAPIGPFSFWKTSVINVAGEDGVYTAHWKMAPVPLK